MLVRGTLRELCILRTEVGGTITCRLVQAGARIDPIKPITIPRLELLACTIGSRLVNNTEVDLGLENVRICCWSDSVNALYWIKRFRLKYLGQLKSFLNLGRRTLSGKKILSQQVILT
ncbi:DUF5641 domain-containing protein [Trichonephila clavipes]|nr:DUF5641 domain-containing protein [Trichonephila clavipes]